LAFVCFLQEEEREREIEPVATAIHHPSILYPLDFILGTINVKNCAGEKANENVPKIFKIDFHAIIFLKHVEETDNESVSEEDNWGQKVLGRLKSHSVFCCLSHQALALFVKKFKKMRKPIKMASHIRVYSDNWYKVNTKANVSVYCLYSTKGERLG